MMLAHVVVATFFAVGVSSHGYMSEPPQRSSLWRAFPDMGFETNFNDNELFCGGFARQWFQNNGKCGTCGDPYDGVRKNEAGGIYATGFIARRYKMGQTIDVQIKLTANHRGYFQFKLCPWNDVSTPVEQECLDKYVLEIYGTNDETRYQPGNVIGTHDLKLILPPDVTCEQCVLQWRYNAANSWNCDDVTGECCIGCGPQETFINCADIAIDGDSNDVPATKRPSTTQPTKPPTTTRLATSTTKQTTPIIPVTPQPTTRAPFPTTKVLPSTTPPTNKVIPTCGNNEIIDCIGVGVNEGIGYEGWCNQYCGIGSAACTPDLCQCRCRSKLKCYAIGAFANIPGLDNYCYDTCQNGCPALKHMCKCE